MTKCTKFPIQFSTLKSKKVLANFEGGSISNNGGILLLNQIDRKLKLVQTVANVFSDPRQTSKVQHSIAEMLKQRVFALALGYEDLNDHSQLKEDGALQVAVGKEKALASPSTLCRFEKSFTRKHAFEVHKRLIENFVKSFKKAPKELVLDFDPTDLPLYGNQQGKAYNGYYGHNCFLPLHVFCSGQMLVSYLRASNQDSVKHAWAILSLLVKYFRKVWPKVKIIFRADAAFVRENILNRCDRNNVNYIVGLSCNTRLQKALEPYMHRAIAAHKKS